MPVPTRPPDELLTPGTTPPPDAEAAPVRPPLADRLAGALPRSSRRGFLGGAAVVASALAVDPFGFILKPGTAYAAVCGDSNTCGSGWSAFCCTINGGRNACPPGSFTAGWWKADNSSFCSGGPRYYIDCNAHVPVTCSCHCASGTCDTNYVCCNQFRYGQCNTQISSFGPVVCRMVTCTPPWQFDASCTTTSRTDNRTRGHNAPCNPENVTPPPPPVANVIIGPGAGRNGDGRLEVVGLAPDRRVQHTWQNAPNSAWSGWFPFPFKAVGSPSAARNLDGRLEVFFVGEDGRMHHSWQWGFDWSPAVPIPGRTFGFFAGAAATENQDGRLEVFANGPDGQLWHAWQTTPNRGSDGWSGWYSLGGQWRGSPGVTSNSDGRLEVFTIAADGQLYHAWQTAPNSGWSGFIPQGGSLAVGNAPAAARNVSGKLQVFALGTDRRLYTTRQAVAGSYWESGWSQLGSSTWRGSPAAHANQDGRLEVFIEGDDRQFWHNWQTSPDGAWSGWQPLGGTSL